MQVVLQLSYNYLIEHAVYVRILFQMLTIHTRGCLGISGYMLNSTYRGQVK